MDVGNSSSSSSSGDKIQNNGGIVKRKTTSETTATTTTNSVDSKQQPTYKKRTDFILVKFFKAIAAFSWAILITSFIWLSLPVVLLVQPILRKLKISPFYNPLDMLSRLWAQVILWIVNVEVEVEGAHHPKSCDQKSTILMYSHASNIDPIILMGYTPVATRFIFKKELLYFVPYIFSLAYLVGHIPINRKKRQSAFESINATAARVAEHNSCVVISPEGTRSVDGKLQPFKKGPFHMAIQSKALIAPVCLFGNHELWPNSNLLPNSGKVYVRYLPPFEIGPDDDVDTLLAKTREKMYESLVNPPKNFEPLEKGQQMGHSIIFLSVLIGTITLILNYFGLF